jgi:putrescine aminotransferase
MGGVLVSDRVAATVVDGGAEFFHGYTYSGHPTCAAAALENLRIIEEENLVRRVAYDIGPYMQRQWQALGEHPLVGEARMVGLIGALELVPAKPSRRLSFAPIGAVGTLARDLSFQNGLIMRAVRDSLIIAPPLTISHGEVDELIRLARLTLDMTWAELKRRGSVA